MIMKKNGTDYIITIIGILMLASGLFFIKTITDPLGYLKALPFICIGLGCGLLGHSMGNVISRKSLRNNPALQKQLEIHKNDERNIANGNTAKAKAYEMMIYVFGALMLSYTLMGIDVIAVLLLVFAYLFVIAYGLYYRYKYDKEN